MLQRGDAAEAEVRLRRVVERVDKALNSYPIRVIAVRNLSILLNATGRPRESVQLLRRFGGDFDPNLRYSLICAECLSGNLEESKRLMVRQLAENPEEGRQALEDEDLAPIRDYIKSLLRLTGAGTDPGKP